LVHGLREGEASSQPLYPALIASVMFLAKDRICFARDGEYRISTLGFVLLYVAILRLYGEHLGAGVVGILYLINPFSPRANNRHLLTEPLHIFLMIGIIYSYLAYQKTKSLRLCRMASRSIA